MGKLKDGWHGFIIFNEYLQQTKSGAALLFTKTLILFFIFQYFLYSKGVNFFKRSSRFLPEVILDHSFPQFHVFLAQRQSGWRIASKKTNKLAYCVLVRLIK